MGFQNRLRRWHVALVALVATTVSAPWARAVDFPEVEPNNSKVEATTNGTITLSPGDTLSGMTTGAVATAGPTSFDYFRIRGEAAAFGIYRYNLTLSATPAGHTVTIRGLDQLTGVPGTTDSTIQTAQTVGTTRVAQWYDFGNEAEIYYRVAGTGTTTGAYSAALTRTPVTPIIGPTLSPGSITISTIGQTTVDTDMWVYDSAGNAIANYGNDDESIVGGGTGVSLQSLLTRTYAAGDYYLAISNFSFTNNQASAADDDYRLGTLLDFPNGALNNSTTAVAVLNPKFTDSNGTQIVTVSKSSAFEVIWIKFTVAVPTVPTGSASFAPSPALQGTNTTLSVAVTPAPDQPDNDIVSVVADLTSIDASLSSNFALTDGGSGTWSGVVNVPLSATDGLKNVTCTMTDASARVGTCVGALTVGYCTSTATGYTCASDEYIVNVTFGAINNNSVCGPPPGYEDYTTISTTVNPGTIVPISVDVDGWFSTTDQVTVYCDWNKNGVFTDVGESTVLTDSGAPAHIYVGNVNVPSDAVVGSTRMRVRLNFGAPTPCGSTTYGNIEDYTLIVSPPVNPVVTNPLAVPSAGGVGTSVQLTANVALATPPFPIASVTVDLTGIDGPSSVAMFDDGNHGDGGADDGLWGVSTTVGAGATPGPKLLPVTATDTNGGVGTANIAFHVCDSDASGCNGFPEPFDGTAGLPPCWVSVNDSPGGLGTNPNWNQTDGGATFPPHSGTGFVAANYNSTVGANNISNYLMSPIIPAMKNGDHVKFWTRCPTHTAPNFWPDRVSVLISTNGGCTSPADFQANPPLLVINPTLAPGGYPEVWTEFDVEVTGITGTVSGRVAFWYNVTNGGPSGTNSDYVGIDDVEYIPGTAACTCYGDMNSDTVVNGADIAGFTACVTGGGSCDCGNLDHAGGVDADDVDEFVTALLAGACGLP